ncbi:uncharacterized protein [Clytia hemisphaerica]|uniref:uncharacterized protein isoform X1 n=2 Tax=Clytia hemisphaerica TaxID=252671 RepID=UPI0034D528BA
MVFLNGHFTGVASHKRRLSLQHQLKKKSFHASCPSIAAIPDHPLDVQERNGIMDSSNPDTQLTPQSKKKKKSWYSISRKTSSDPITSKHKNDPLASPLQSRSYENESRLKGYFEGHHRAHSHSPFLTSFRKKVSNVKNVFRSHSHQHEPSFTLEKAASCSNLHWSGRTESKTSFLSDDNIFVTLTPSTPGGPRTRKLSTGSSIGSNYSLNSTKSDDDAIHRHQTVKETSGRTRKVSWAGAYQPSIREDDILKTGNPERPNSTTPVRRKVSWADQTDFPSPRNSLLLSQSPISETPPSPRPAWFPSDDDSTETSFDIEEEDEDKNPDYPNIIPILESDWKLIENRIYEDSKTNLFYNNRKNNANNDEEISFHKPVSFHDNQLETIDDVISNNDYPMTFVNTDNKTNGIDKITDKNNQKDFNDGQQISVKNRCIEFENRSKSFDYCMTSSSNSVDGLVSELEREKETDLNNNIMKSTAYRTSSVGSKPTYIYSVQSSKANYNELDIYKKKRTLGKHLNSGISQREVTPQIDLNNNNILSSISTNSNIKPLSKAVSNPPQTPSRMLGNSIVKKPYALDDLYISSQPVKHNKSNVFEKNYLNHANQQQHRNYKLPPSPKYGDKQTPLVSKTPPTPTENKEVKSVTHVSVNEIRVLVEGILKRKLGDKTFDETLVTSWCKDIVNTVRDQVKLITDTKRKVIASTYIGPKSQESSVHVAIQCQKQMNKDDFITVAYESESLFVWVSLMMANY